MLQAAQSSVLCRPLAQLALAPGTFAARKLLQQLWRPSRIPLRGFSSTTAAVGSPVPPTTAAANAQAAAAPVAPIVAAVAASPAQPPTVPPPPPPAVPVAPLPVPVKPGNKGALWFDSVYPILTWRWDPRKYLGRFVVARCCCCSMSVNARRHNHEKLIPPRMPPFARITEMKPRYREGGSSPLQHVRIT